ncbi:hypothetical protein PYW07_001446 [Mythimna separata]|uniref:EGF-like domain-containing protein n=1 Tax=Mythimna separata TaxID=271217 RepID=A0AAD7YV14_MYTSE|nr:hypothetical protein PYW07_001446 [Mythimna separata]
MEPFFSVISSRDYRDVPETFLYTYLEAYEKTDCLFWCTATRVATAMGTRTVRKLIPEHINVCCEGYIKDENNDGNSSSIHCKPNCSPACVNGYCKSPGVCACNPGYLPDVFEENACSPLCIKGCEHGTCTAPNICICDSGYQLKDGVCEPICSEPCLHGSCIAPETCQCLPGYKKTQNDTCEPFCSSYTATGECIITIVCEPGWTNVIKNSVETCEPVCPKPCVNSTCIAPEICECLNGYEKTANDMCKPYCFQCVHGSCISPHTCVCDPGWYRTESSGTCLPHCDYNCGNGTCIAPNTCQCYQGYELDKSVILEEQNTGLCVPMCSNCEGACIAPDICLCEPHEEMTLVNADGGPCDCVNNCSDDATKCEKTICVNISTVASVTMYDKDEATEEMIRATFMITTTDATSDEANTIVESGLTDYNELKIEKASSWYNSDWFYAMGSIFILMFMILMAAIFLKRKYLESLRKMIFSAHNTENDMSATTVHYKQNST